MDPQLGIGSNQGLFYELIFCPLCLGTPNSFANEWEKEGITIALTSFDSSDAFGTRLNQIRGGESAVVNEMLERWRPYVRAAAHNMLTPKVAGRFDSSDIVQETLVRIHHSVEQFNGKTRAEWASWIKQILLNEARRSRRHHLAEKRSVASEDYRSDTNLQADEASPNPLDALIAIERSVRVMTALRQLKQPMRDVLIHRIFVGEPFKEIALRLHRSESATRMLWTRGIQALREIVDSAVFDAGE